MASIKSFKTACIILLLLGILTIGVGVWLIAFPVKIAEATFLTKEVTLERGYYAQVGLAAGGLMSLIGLAACCPLPERCPRVFAFGVFLALILCGTCAGMAVYSHENDEDVNIITATAFEKQYKELQTREKVMAACAIMDCIAEVIALLIFCLVRTSSSARNVV